jgi:hypothetical protein
MVWAIGREMPKARNGFLWLRVIELRHAPL